MSAIRSPSMSGFPKLVDAGGGGPAALVPELQRPPAGGRRVSRVEVAVVAGVVIILGSIIAFTWPSIGDDEGHRSRRRRSSSSRANPPTLWSHLHRTTTSSTICWQSRCSLMRAIWPGRRTR